MSRKKFAKSSKSFCIVTCAFYHISLSVYVKNNVSVFLFSVEFSFLISYLVKAYLQSVLNTGTVKLLSNYFIAPTISIGNTLLFLFISYFLFSKIIILKFIVFFRSLFLAFHLLDCRKVYFYLLTF